MYPLLETIKIKDGLPQFLEWHQDRLDRSFVKLFKKASPYILEELLEVPSECQQGVYKCRFLYGLKETQTEYLPYEPGKISMLKLVHVKTLDYALKYTDRSAINDLLKRKGAADDILIIKNGIVTDTSYSNIVFYDGREWVTPRNPLLAGTARARLVFEGEIRIADLRVEDLESFERFKLINAMLDFHEQDQLSVKKSVLP